MRDHKNEASVANPRLMLGQLGQEHDQGPLGPEMLGLKTRFSQSSDISFQIAHVGRDRLARSPLGSDNEERQIPPEDQLLQDLLEELKGIKKTVENFVGRLNTGSVYYQRSGTSNKQELEKAVFVRGSYGDVGSLEEIYIDLIGGYPHSAEVKEEIVGFLFPEQGAVLGFFSRVMQEGLDSDIVTYEKTHVLMPRSTSESPRVAGLLQQFEGLEQAPRPSLKKGYRLSDDQDSLSREAYRHSFTEIYNSLVGLGQRAQSPGRVAHVEFGLHKALVGFYSGIVEMSLDDVVVTFGSSGVLLPCDVLDQAHIVELMKRYRGIRTESSSFVLGEAEVNGPAFS